MKKKQVVAPYGHVEVLQLGKNTAAETENEDKNSLCSCFLGKDVGIVLNENLNMNQQYFPP